MASRPLIRESLYFLNMLGTDPYKQNQFSSIKITLTIVILLFVFVNSLLEFVLNWGGSESIEALTVCCAFCLLLIKICTMIIKRKQLLNLIDKMNLYWKPDKYGKNTKQEIDAMYRLMKKTGIFMISFVIILALFYVIFPLMGRNKGLPFKSYYPRDLKQSSQFETVFIVESLGVAIAVVCAFGFDGLFISLAVNLIIELKIVKHAFKSVNLNPQAHYTSHKTLQKYCTKIIDHHNLVLNCIKEMRRIYSILLLFVYFLNMSCICVGLLGIVASGFPPPLRNLSTYSIFTTFFTTQLFLYCVVGNYLMNESESVSCAVYDTDWWIETQPEYRRLCVMVIQRSNLKEELTAGGMFSLNMDSFRKIVKSALSFFTVLEAVYTNNESSLL